MRYEVVVTIMALGIVGQVSGQTTPSTAAQVTIANRTRPKLDAGRIQKVAIKLEEQAAKHRWDPRAEILLTCAEKATSSLLRLELTGIRTR